jgi:uncharacterized protein YrrD
MLLLSASFANKPILSLRTGGEIGKIQGPIINPNNLKIEGYYCVDRFSKQKLVLLSQEIREVIEDGVIVNDHDSMTQEEDLVRLRKVLDIKFNIINKKVVTKRRQNLGKINDYAINSDNMYIQKMYVSQPLVKSLNGGQLSIDRSQIVEVTDKKIVVNDPTVYADDKQPVGAPVAA